MTNQTDNRGDMNATPEATHVVWHSETHLVQHTGKDAYQVYERIPDTNNWERLPRGGIVFYESLEAAIATLPSIERRSS
jgi:hypothetical protein